MLLLIAQQICGMANSAVSGFVYTVSCCGTYGETLLKSIPLSAALLCHFTQIQFVCLPPRMHNLDYRSVKE